MAVLPAPCPWLSRPVLSRVPAPPQVACSDALPVGSELSLDGFTLKRLAHFLRFTYHPDEVGGLGGGMGALVAGIDTVRNAV